MPSILTRQKVEEFLATGNDIAVPILTLVKEVSGIFPPLQSAAGGALFIAEKVKVSTMHPGPVDIYPEYLGVSGEQSGLGGIWDLHKGDGW